MDVPIVTSDRPFAHDVCHDAAVYGDPYDAEQLAGRVFEVVTDEPLRRSLVEAGKKRLRDFGDAQDRFEQHLALFEKLTAVQG